MSKKLLEMGDELFYESIKVNLTFAKKMQMLKVCLNIHEERLRDRNSKKIPLWEILYMNNPTVLDHFQTLLPIVDSVMNRF